MKTIFFISINCVITMCTPFCVAAPVTRPLKNSVILIEYYDYECPHCRRMEAVIDCLQNIVQTHRDIKSRYKVMKGFKNCFCALVLCTVFEEIRQFFRMSNKTRGQRRKLLARRINQFNQLMTSTT